MEPVNPKSRIPKENLNAIEIEVLVFLVMNLAKKLLGRRLPNNFMVPFHGRCLSVARLQQYY